MLIDLLARSNYVSYNIVLANLLGLHTSIYLNALMDINSKAIRKNKVDDQYFTLDRKYIKSITTLDVEEQKSLDKKLLQLGILKKKENTDTDMMLDISVITSLLMNKDETVISDIKKIVKAKADPKTKAEFEIEKCRSRITTDNAELRDAYSDWIQSVYAKQGWMSMRSVTIAQQVIDEYTKRNLDVALKIIGIAAINGYRDMQWAINSYEKDYNVKYTLPVEKQERVVTMSDIKF